jgi:chaperonin GroEL (HSP60 family)
MIAEAVQKVGKEGGDHRRGGKVGTASADHRRGIKLENVTIGMPGHAERVSITKDDTTIVDGADQKVGINIVRRALQAPARQIAENAGEDGAVVAGKILDAGTKPSATTRRPASTVTS